MIRLREAVADDAAALNEIYNHYVLHSTATFQTEPSTVAERQRWLADHGPAHPVVVAEDDGSVLGWASLSRFHTRAAYAATVEDSIYVSPDVQRRGIGRLLLGDLLSRVEPNGYHTVLAIISVESIASIALHVAHGFTEVGRLHEVGYKFGRWIDVVYYQLKPSSLRDPGQ